jgi:hypothetical protein
MATRTLKSAINVEWINVTYRSVGVTVVLLVGGLAAGAYWYWSNHMVPKEDAQASIDLAADRLTQALTLDIDEPQAEIRGNAKVLLDVARAEFDKSAYGEARVAAMRSEKQSARVISMAEGTDDDKHLVQFSKIEGDVRVKRAGGFSWDSASTKMVLRPGDQVKTSSHGSAEVIYFDGTVTRVAPGTLLEIRDLYEDPVTKVRRVREKLTWGEVQASTQKRNVSGSYHEVATDKVAARAEDEGEFRIAFDNQEKTSVVDVFNGRVELATPGRKTTLQGGERVTASAEGRLSAKVSLPGVPRLLLPSDQRVFVFEDPGQEKVTLNWEQMHEVERYRLMIAEKALFTEPLVDTKRERANAVLEGLSEGAYHWKVAALSKSGVEGPFSAPRRFRVSSQRIRDRTDSEPPGLRVLEFVPVGQMVIINGSTDPDAKLWIDNNKVEVYEDGSFNAVVKLRREGLNQLLIVAQDPSGNETSLTRQAYVELF